MDPIKIIELKESILADNGRDAAGLRDELRKAHIFYVNIMSSPGSGKTSVLVRTIQRLMEMRGDGGIRVGVMEADIDSDVDAQTIRRETGVPAVQLHTGGMCHLDAEMSRQGLHGLGLSGPDSGGPGLVFLENVGNLVCPAEFDTGAHLNVAILSVPEGDDKPLKYPLMFTKCRAVLISKIDAAPAFDFDMEKCRAYILERNPDAQIFPVSAVTGEGIDIWCAWLLEQVAAGDCRKNA